MQPRRIWIAIALATCFCWNVVIFGQGQDSPPTSTPPSATSNSPKKSETTTSTDEWVKVAVDNTNISVLMPSTPVTSQRVISAVSGTKTTVNLNIVEVGRNKSFVFAYNDVPKKPEDLLQIERILDGGVKGAVARTFGELVSVKKIEVGKLPGRDFVFECIQGETDQGIRLRVTSRLVLVGQTLYQMTYVAPLNEHNDAEAKKFVESFSQ